MLTEFRRGPRRTEAGAWGFCLWEGAGVLALRLLAGQTHVLPPDPAELHSFSGRFLVVLM